MRLQHQLSIGTDIRVALFASAGEASHAARFGHSATAIWISHERILLGPLALTDRPDNGRHVAYCAYPSCSACPAYPAYFACLSHLLRIAASASLPIPWWLHCASRIARGPLGHLPVVSSLDSNANWYYEVILRNILPKN
jgi:hypothetical protein